MATVRGCPPGVAFYVLRMLYRPVEREEKAAEPHSYSRIWVTTPAPTVLPPSRMAKRRPS